ncbi:Crp/Fnr family transcriptional regulator [Mesorhizobium neociceri]|uniref:Crp/Fnr family transcriptional regulator n=1 Tax=Mesorhizobium neociceri TaxID=1307853 RepID=UPI002E2B10BA|nr:helix-turn-helix domain-containing protein [Mesorhizobium neociceri]
MRALLLRFVHTFLVQVSQTAYANAGYSVEERLARWLLMTHDRLDHDDMPITHEFMSIMLGSRRPGVTIAVQTLEGTGAIRATRGNITLRDRQKLEQIAGQSYGFAEKEYSNVFQSRSSEADEVDVRYFMNIRCCGRLIPDPEGDEVSDEEAVHGHALATARDLVFGTRMDTIRSWGYLPSVVSVG